MITPVADRRAIHCVFAIPTADNLTVPTGDILIRRLHGSSRKDPTLWIARKSYRAALQSAIRAPGIPKFGRATVIDYMFGDPAHHLSHLA